MRSLAVIFLVSLFAQSSRMDALVAAVRPLLPYPAATADGDLPSNNSAQSKWFVAWPDDPGDTRIVIKANPLHPDTQKAGAEAMDEINQAVAAAERRAQAAYDKAMEQLRKTGKGSDLESVTLDDEGIAGERIDAELEMTIELAGAESFDINSSEPPLVAEGARGAQWIVTVPPNTYRRTQGDDRREHFRAAETHVYFGLASKPAVDRQGDDARYRVTVAPSPRAFTVILRGNEELVTRLATGTDWLPLATR
jgi:hypothetical protein